MKSSKGRWLLRLFRTLYFAFRLESALDTCLYALLGLVFDTNILLTSNREDVESMESDFEALESQAKIPQKPTMTSRGERPPGAKEQRANHDLERRKPLVRRNNPSRDHTLQKGFL